MRIFYITTVLGAIGGSEIYCKDIIEEMIRKGHEVFVFSNSDYNVEGAKHFKFKTFGHHALHKWEMLLHSNKALKLAKEFKPDVIQSHSNSMAGMVGSYVAGKLKVPHLLLIELITSKNKNLHTKAIYAWEKFFLPKTKFNKLVVWTNHMKNNFCLPWGIPEEKIKVIPAAINTEKYDLEKEGITGKEMKNKYGEHLIVSIKSLWGTNALGIKYIIKAMKYVSEKYPKYKYIIMGWGEERKKLEKLVKELKLEKNVVFTGAIDEKTKKEAWAAAEIAPHSFIYEFSTSISLLEFMAVGKANIVTDIGAVKEYVKDSALTVGAMDEKAIAEGIIKLIENPELRKDLEKRAKKLVKENYSIESSVEKLEKVYMRVKYEKKY